MPQSHNENDNSLKSFNPFPMMQSPLFSLFAEVNGTVLHAFAAAQKDWAEFVHNRVSEELAVLRQLMQCHSPAEMHQVYAEYLSKAFQQYQEQSAKIVQRGQAMTQQTSENAKESARSRH